MSKKRSLRILVPLASPYLYGAERTILETFDALRPEVEPHFLLSHGAKRRNLPILAIMKAKGFSYSFLSDRNDWPVPGKPKSIRHLISMLSAMVKGNIDILKGSRGKDAISIANAGGLYHSILACIVLRIRGKRVMFRFHELMIPWTPYSLALKLASPLITDFLHHTQHSFDQTIRVNSFLAGRNNSIIPPVVLIRTNEVGDNEAKFFANKQNIVYVGQVSPHKGIDLLIDAFEKNAADHEDIVLHILGGCSETYQEEFHQRIKPLQEQGKIRYWGYREDVHSFVEMALVLVQPTRPSMYHEGYARTIIEAMILGVPAVCFRSGALQEVVVHEATGLICEEESSKCLEESVRRFLDDSDFRSNCSRKSLERYQQHYSTEKVKELWLQFFRKNK